MGRELRAGGAVKTYRKLGADERRPGAVDVEALGEGRALGRREGLS